MQTKDANKGALLHGHGQPAVPAVFQATRRRAATTSGADRAALDQAWVAAYERGEAAFDGELRKVGAPVPRPAGRVARAVKWLLVEGVCRGLLPGRVVATAFARWPQLRRA